jgi:hypothetical protein
MPPPLSSTPTMRLKKMMATTVTALTTMKLRTTSSSSYYSFLFPFWCLDAKGGEEAIFLSICVIVNNVKSS